LVGGWAHPAPPPQHSENAPPAVGVLSAALLLVPVVARIRAEERLLREHFGAEYDAYCARTWRLVPGIY